MTQIKMYDYKLSELIMLIINNDNEEIVKDAWYAAKNKDVSFDNYNQIITYCRIDDVALDAYRLFGRTYDCSSFVVHSICSETVAILAFEAMNKDNNHKVINDLADIIKYSKFEKLSKIAIKLVLTIDDTIDTFIKYCTDESSIAHPKVVSRFAFKAYVKKAEFDYETVMKMAKHGVTINIVIDSIDLFKCFDMVEYTDLYSLMLRNYTNNKIVKKCWDMFLVQETFYTPMFFDYLSYILSHERLNEFNKSNIEPWEIFKNTRSCQGASNNTLVFDLIMSPIPHISYGAWCIVKDLIRNNETRLLTIIHTATYTQVIEEAALCFFNLDFEPSSEHVIRVAIKCSKIPSVVKAAIKILGEFGRDQYPLKQLLSELLKENLVVGSTAKFCWSTLTDTYQYINRVAYEYAMAVSLDHVANNAFDRFLSEGSPDLDKLMSLAINSNSNVVALRAFHMIGDVTIFSEDRIKKLLNTNWHNIRNIVWDELCSRPSTDYGTFVVLSLIGNNEEVKTLAKEVLNSELYQEYARLRELV
jgi:hypothetical protein